MLDEEEQEILAFAQGDGYTLRLGQKWRPEDVVALAAKGLVKVTVQTTTAGVEELARYGAEQLTMGGWKALRLARGAWVNPALREQIQRKPWERTLPQPKIGWPVLLELERLGLATVTWQEEPVDGQPVPRMAWATESGLRCLKLRPNDDEDWGIPKKE